MQIWLKFLKCKDKFHNDRKETDLIGDVCINTRSHGVWKAIAKLIQLDSTRNKATGKKRRNYVVEELEVCTCVFSFCAN